MPEPKYDFALIANLRDKGIPWKTIRDEHYPETTIKNLVDCFSQSKRKRGRTAKTTPPAGSLPKAGAVTADVKGNTATTAVLVENRPKSEADLAELFDMDLDVWEPTQIKTGHWNGWAVIENVPTIADLYNVKVTWNRREGVATAKKVIDAVLARKGVKAGRLTKPAKPSGAGVLALNVPDLHLGKLCWPRETGDSPYDLGIAMECFASCVTDLAAKHKASAHGDPAEILLPVGNDFLNSDGPIGGKGAFTAAGTQQDEDGRWQKSFEFGLYAILDAVAVLKKRFPKSVIRIPIVPGNHDETRIFYLGVALRVEFRKDLRVIVDAEPTGRKFYDGLEACNVPVCIMWTHGHREKPATYPALLSHHFDLRQYASKEVHTGHLHSQRGVSFDTYKEIENLLARQFPSLSPADSWHAQQGYILSQKCAQSIYYGPTGHAEAITNHYPHL